MSSKKRIAKMRYEFTAGARYSVAADVAGAELERIQNQRGVIEPRVVVEESRPEAAPLHPVFEWNDDKAAENYRTWQARILIKSVRVIELRDGADVPVPVYVHVPTAAASKGDDGIKQTPSGYQPVSVVVQRPDMYASAMIELQRKIGGARESLDSLQRAAKCAPDTDQERMARISIAVQAMQTASAAVQALH